LQKSSLRIWINAARPQTLTAACVPVLVGASLAFNDQKMNWIASAVALLCALLIQIGTNFANDYFDFKKGADNDQRIGFVRATAAGLVKPKTMLFATTWCMGLAFLAGLYLVWIGGWVILLIGILSLLFGILYTGGPFPLGYNGLGDVFVFIFFGFVAVMGTYYVNALDWSVASFWCAIPVGALCTNILVINNLRDVEQDRKAEKKTLGVLFGDTALKIEYTIMVFLAYAVPVFLFIRFEFSPWILLPFLSFPIAIVQNRKTWNEPDKQKLNKLLENTAKLMGLFGILFSIGIITG